MESIVQDLQLQEKLKNLSFQKAEEFSWKKFVRLFVEALNDLDEII